MIPPLSLELEKRIEEEANEAATIKAWSWESHIKGDTSYTPRVDPIRKAFFKKGAIPYAELWQEAEQRAADLNLALAAMLNGYQNLSMYQKDWFSVPKDLIDAYTKMVMEYDK